MRRLTVAIIATLTLSACGSAPHPTPTVRTLPAGPPAAAATCPAAADGHGTMGACAPPSVGLHNNKSATLVGPITYPDLSNNNPVNDGQMAAIGRHHPAVYLKTNQGTGFIDRTFAVMAASAHRHHLAVGGYDFVSCYCAAEARLFVSLLHRAGQTRHAARWLPPTLDVEYANATRGGLATMVSIVRAAFGRVNIYTGAWYWTPHVGCYWPTGASGWLAGYPRAPIVCGLHARSYTQHQYTDRGFNGATTSDMSVWLSTPRAFRHFARLPAHHKPQPRPHRHVTAGDRLECRHLQYDRRKHYLPTAHRRWRALHATGITCSKRRGAYLTPGGTS